MSTVVVGRAQPDCAGVGACSKTWLARRDFNICSCPCTCPGSKSKPEGSFFGSTTFQAPPSLTTTVFFPGDWMVTFVAFCGSKESRVRSRRSLAFLLRLVALYLGIKYT